MSLIYILVTITLCYKIHFMPLMFIFPGCKEYSSEVKENGNNAISKIISVTWLMVNFYKCS